MKAERLGQVLYDITTHKGSKAAVDAFFAYIHARGYARLLPQILAEYERLSEVTKESTIVVTTATKRDVKSILAANSIDAKESTRAHTRIDETIVGGYTIETDSRFIDASHKNALIRLYQTLTH